MNLLMRPVSIRLRKCGDITPKCDRGRPGRYRGDQSVNIAFNIGFIVPIRVLVLVWRDAQGDYILQVALPPMPPLVRCQTIEYGLVGGVLQADV